MPSPLTTHVLDTALGRPAVGVAIRLFRADEATLTELAVGATNDDGRITDLIPDDSTRTGAWRAGDYVLCFDVAEYFANTGQAGFYPEVSVRFTVTDPTQHHHVPLLLSPFGYSTYRGS